MASSNTILAVVGGLAVIGVVLGAASFINAGAAPTNTMEPPQNRLIWMEAVEYKGSTETAKLAPPQNLASDPKSLGPAFGFKWLEPNTKWEVSAYAFTPSTVVVNQGDKVTLRIFGINGDLHKNYIEYYVPNPVELNRGRSTDITFTANKPGLFQIACSNHEPAMRGWLIVNSRPA